MSGQQGRRPQGRQRVAQRARESGLQRVGRRPMRSTRSMTRHFWHSLAAGAACVTLGVTLAAHQAQGNGQSTDEDIARRQLESGRPFLRQGNYAEALKAFRAVADTHATSSVADDALLEIGRYYFEIANDYPAATTAVDDLLKKYPTSNSAPDAYVLSGRLALAR